MVELPAELIKVIHEVSETNSSDYTAVDNAIVNLPDIVPSKLSTFIDNLRLGVGGAIVWVRTNLDDTLDDLEENIAADLMNRLENLISIIIKFLNKNRPRLIT